MPSMPSVPLMSARPSLARSASGSSPASRARRRPRRVAVGVATSPSPISASAQWASGARSPLAPSEPCSGTTGRDAGVEQRRACVSTTTGPGAGVAHRQRAGPQQHHRPHDLALDRRRPCRRRASGSARAAAPAPLGRDARCWRASRSRWRRRRPARSAAARRSTTRRARCHRGARVARRAAPRTPWRATATTSGGSTRSPVSSIVAVAIAAIRSHRPGEQISHKLAVWDTCRGCAKSGLG